ncbi:NUDIX domain-containing protein [Pseudomonas sp. dw_358]|uniref:NUDIX hydrolase n=1 Tax=Pseudomonas sp. dw_358 TaxID=2720083 RepID=UPI001BD65B1B|nr:NUDIX domain-containing protein [Pseudomonas sp. dw_358]
MGASDSTAVKDKPVKRRATVIFRRDDQILFVRKRKSKWNLPGGRVEPDETPMQAAVREMAEETGVALDQLEYVSEYVEDRVIHYLFESRLPARQKPRPCNEIADCRWFNAREMDKRNVLGSIRALLKRSEADVSRQAL